ncbi:hypothetical protein OKW43_001209 [Paraburkholderia sp. WC7.3g]
MTLARNSEEFQEISLAYEASRPRQSVDAGEAGAVGSRKTSPEGDRPHC